MILALFLIIWEPGSPLFCSSFLLFLFTFPCSEVDNFELTCNMCCTVSNGLKNCVIYYTHTPQFIAEDDEKEYYYVNTVTMTSVNNITLDDWEAVKTRPEIEVDKYAIAGSDCANDPVIFGPVEELSSVTYCVNVTNVGSANIGTLDFEDNLGFDGSSPDQPSPKFYAITDCDADGTLVPGETCFLSYVETLGYLFLCLFVCYFQTTINHSFKCILLTNEFFLSDLSKMDCARDLAAGPSCNVTNTVTVTSDNSKFISFFINKSHSLLLIDTPKRISDDHYVETDVIIYVEKVAVDRGTSCDTASIYDSVGNEVSFFFGEFLTYCIRVTNYGASSLSNVVLVYVKPPLFCSVVLFFLLLPSHFLP